MLGSDEVVPRYESTQRDEVREKPTRKSSNHHTEEIIIVSEAGAVLFDPIFQRIHDPIRHEPHVCRHVPMFKLMPQYKLFRGHACMQPDVTDVTATQVAQGLIVNASWKTPLPSLVFPRVLTTGSSRESEQAVAQLGHRQKSRTFGHCWGNGLFAN